MNDCCICQRPDPLVQDHDHTNGLCRGMICRSCNIELGLLERKIELEDLLRAYIAEWKVVHTTVGGKRYYSHKRRAGAKATRTIKPRNE